LVYIIGMDISRKILLKFYIKIMKDVCNKYIYIYIYIYKINFIYNKINKIKLIEFGRENGKNTNKK